MYPTNALNNVDGGYCPGMMMCMKNMTKHGPPPPKSDPAEYVVKEKETNFVPDKPDVMGHCRYFGKWLTI